MLAKRWIHCVSWLSANKGIEFSCLGKVNLHEPEWSPVLSEGLPSSTLHDDSDFPRAPTSYYDLPSSPVPQSPLPMPLKKIASSSSIPFRTLLLILGVHALRVHASSELQTWWASGFCQTVRSRPEAHCFVLLSHLGVYRYIMSVILSRRSSRRISMTDYPYPSNRNRKMRPRARSRNHV